MITRHHLTKNALLCSQEGHESAFSIIFHKDEIRYRQVFLVKKSIAKFFPSARIKNAGERAMQVTLRGKTILGLSLEKEEKIMKFVIAVFRLIFTPLALVLAVLAGLLAAAVSALIEYNVLQEWLRPEGTGLVFLPLIIVVSLEGTKLFLHFFGGALQQNNLTQNERYLLSQFRNILPWIRNGLVIFSFVCSIIFTANAFYRNSVTRESDELTAARESISAEYDAKMATENEQADTVYQQAIATPQEQLQTAKANWEKIEIVYTPLRDYQRTSAEKAAAWDIVEECQKHLEEAEATARSEREASVEAAREQLDSWKEQELAKLDNSVLGAVAGDNVYLRNFLLFFSQTFFGKEYSRSAYFVWVILISLTISALLEGVIILSQYVISFPVSVLEQMAGNFAISEREKQKLTYVVQVVVSMMISLALFLIYGAVQELVYTGVDIGAAVVSTMITVLIPTVVTTIEWNHTASGWRKIAKDVFSEARSTVVKGLLAFAGFVFIGLLFGESFATLSMPAIGISLGNAAGHLFHLEPFAFSKERTA